ncbi:MAG TPA: hypothetical protein VFV09_09100 [Actinomycetota bacterium]|jgi:hypothetical protein|nr:hypothetical protein [Actinomycetota bacterium]
MPDGEMKVPPMSVQLQMAEAALEIQQIANREATLARTATKNSKDFLGSDVDAWIAMALRLDEALAVAEHHAEFLRRSFEQYGPWLNQQIQQTLTSDHFQPDQIEQITTILDVKDGDFSDLGLSLAGTVVERIPGSRKELRDLAFDIKGMAVPVMDWHHVGCTMIDVAMMAGLALCIPTEGAGCVVALGGMIAHAAFC